MPRTEPVQPLTSDRSGWVHESVRTLSPGYFALVMATGIVSIAMANHHARAVSVLLLWLTCIEYAVLLMLYGWRLIAFAPETLADLADPARAFGFFTFVAATDVLGTRLAADGHFNVPLVMLTIAALAWLVLGYVIPGIAVLGRVPRPVLARANGTWFIWAVASQSVAVLAATLEPSTDGSGRGALALLAVSCWSVGVFLYAASAGFVAARSMLYDFGPADLTPPYWVSMGATAITVVAGARIVQMADTPMVTATRELIAGASVVFWVFGTWLIPVLVAGGVWRHVVHRVPLRYEAAMWSIVFPLGMYSVAGFALGRADNLPVVEDIGAAMTWVALTAWVLTFVAMLAHLFQARAKYTDVEALAG